MCVYNETNLRDLNINSNLSWVTPGPDLLTCQYDFQVVQQE